MHHGAADAGRQQMLRCRQPRQRQRRPPKPACAPPVFRPCSRRGLANLHPGSHCHGLAPAEDCFLPHNRSVAHDSYHVAIHRTIFGQSARPTVALRKRSLPVPPRRPRHGHAFRDQGIDPSGAASERWIRADPAKGGAGSDVSRGVSILPNISLRCGCIRRCRYLCVFESQPQKVAREEPRIQQRLGELSCAGTAEIEAALGDSIVEDRVRDGSMPGSRGMAAVSRKRANGRLSPTRSASALKLYTGKSPSVAIEHSGRRKGRAIPTLAFRTSASASKTADYLG